ncbi:MAG: ArnT family glycosyltransferase [Deltaproteobacteria bacterium]
MTPAAETRSEKNSDPDAWTPKGHSAFLSVVVVFYFALIFTLLCASSFVQKSPTVDEPVHLAAGYSYLKWDDFRANPEHPPLAKLWAALPLLLFDIKDSRLSRPHWDLIPEKREPLATIDFARDMLFVDNDGEALFFLAKLQMIALAVVLGTLVYTWSRKLFGFEAGLAALFLFAFDPNILAHSQIVHTDMPFALFFFLSIYGFWSFLERASWRNLLLTSLFFGLAAITKYSYVAIIPIWIVLGLVKVCSDEPLISTFTRRPRVIAGWRGKMMLLAGLLVAALMAAYVVVWAAYDFRFQAIRGGFRPLHMDWVMPEIGSPFYSLLAFVNKHHLFPEAWVYGQLYVQKYLSRSAFLLGEISPDGFWSYFPVAFVVKTPLPTLVLLAVSLWMILCGRLNRRTGLFLLIPPTIYFLSAVWARKNLGVRYILPIYPFLFVVMSGAVAELWRSQSRSKRGCLILLAVWYLGSCISIYPDFLAFFNEVAGGPKNGYKVLLDSNLDWGQDLKGLKRWMDANQVNKIKLLYFGTVDPEYYGIDASYIQRSWIGYDPPATRTLEVPQYAAMSAHLLFQVLAKERTLDLFRSAEPVAIIGHSILVFKLNENGVPSRPQR